MSSTMAIQLRHPLGAVESLRLVAYIRVSTESQAKNSLSLMDQYSMMEDWCAINGHQLSAVLWDIESGDQVKHREGMLTCVRLCNQDQADGILFFNFDRFFRDVGWSE